MRNRFIEGVEAAYQRKEVPEFEIGDTVAVGVRIVEGNKERVQPFIGVVIARRGKGMSETFTVRRIVANEGVERVFPIHSPRVVSIDVQRRGKVRRGKLYFLRDRVGKARKLRERRVSSAKARGAARKQPPDEEQGTPAKSTPPSPPAQEEEVPASV
ncbi:MAG: 50S ribosomal protein L19 [Phycisphaerae bacterium]|nr:50S ribosomal protein L19 [Phycisphaerae bacterium]